MTKVGIYENVNSLTFALFGNLNWVKVSKSFVVQADCFFGVWFRRVRFHAYALLAASDLISQLRPDPAPPRGAVYTFFAHQLRHGTWNPPCAYFTQWDTTHQHIAGCAGALLVWAFLDKKPLEKCTTWPGLQKLLWRDWKHTRLSFRALDGPETYAKVSSVVHIIWNKQMW